MYRQVESLIENEELLLVCAHIEVVSAEKTKQFIVFMTPSPCTPTGYLAKKLTDINVCHCPSVGYDVNKYKTGSKNWVLNVPIHSTIVAQSYPKRGFKPSGSGN